MQSAFHRRQNRPPLDLGWCTRTRKSASEALVGVLVAALSVAVAVAVVSVLVPMAVETASVAVMVAVGVKVTSAVVLVPSRRVVASPSTTETPSPRRVLTAPVTTVPSPRMVVTIPPMIEAPSPTRPPAPRAGLMEATTMTAKRENLEENCMLLKEGVCRGECRGEVLKSEERWREEEKRVCWMRKRGDGDCEKGPGYIPLIPVEQR